jgi:GrpB-like predicted nucleotidyltransferase (UPF0157 family)
VTAEYDAYLDQILVGGREPVEIVICEFDPGWRQRFAAEQRRLNAALGDQAIAIEHIGSTEVPGLAAKPIIDILVTVDAIEPDDWYRSRLEAIDYLLRVREPEHRMFRTPDRELHVHVWPAGHELVDKCLIFRDWLRHDAADRVLYEQYKRQLAQRQWSDMNHYAAAKSEVIVPILQRASWAASQRLGPWASSPE